MYGDDDPNCVPGKSHFWLLSVNSVRFPLGSGSALTARAPLSASLSLFKVWCCHVLPLQDGPKKPHSNIVFCAVEGNSNPCQERWWRGRAWSPGLTEQDAPFALVPSPKLAQGREAATATPEVRPAALTDLWFNGTEMPSGKLGSKSGRRGPSSSYEDQ